MSERIRNIVVGIAETEDQDPHFAFTVQLAESLDATLHLVHAFPVLDPNLLQLGAVEADIDGFQGLLSDVQDRLRANTHEVFGSDRIVCHAIPGSPSDSILDVADTEGADLIVVGATRRGAVASAILGTTAQRVLRGSPVPVLVKRLASDDGPRRVLLTTDLSAVSGGVHERGLALVRTLWGHANQAVRSLFVAGDDVLLPPPLHQVAMRRWAEEQLGKFLGDPASGGLDVEGKVRLGLTAREILAEAEEWRADLLVLGSRGRTGAYRFRIGSVAESVLRRALCDVLLIPTPTLGSGTGGDEGIA